MALAVLPGVDPQCFAGSRVDSSSRGSCGCGGRSSNNSVARQCERSNERRVSKTVHVLALRGFAPFPT